MRELREKLLGYSYLFEERIFSVLSEAVKEVGISLSKTRLKEISRETFSGIFQPEKVPTLVYVHGIKLTSGTVFSKFVSTLLKLQREIKEVSKQIHLSYFEREMFFEKVDSFVEELLLETIAYRLSRLEQEIDRGRLSQNYIKKLVHDFRQLLLSQMILLSNISHEMRTPLNALLGYLQILKDDNEISPEKKIYIENATVSGEVLLRLINDVLDAAKISAGQLELYPQPFWLDSVAISIWKTFKQLAAVKGLKFNISSTPVPYMLLGDKERIIQIINNIVSNAVKFTEKGFVNVVIEKRKETLEELELLITVKDSGCGIPEEKKDELFKPFKRLQREQQGTGLGLFISKNLAKRMGGDLWFESKEGKGSAFYISLRLPKVPLLQEQPLKGRRFVILYGKDCPSFVCNVLENQCTLLGAKIKRYMCAKRLMEDILKNRISKIDYFIVVEPIDDKIFPSSIVDVMRFILGKGECRYLLISEDENKKKKKPKVFDYVFSSYISIEDILDIEKEK